MSHIQRFPSAAKAASTNPLKMSQPLGAALAYLGVDRCLPLFHGSQGCTAFGLVLLVRHFREAIPLAVVGLGVNLASAWLLFDSGHHHHGHAHHDDDSDHDDHEHAHDTHHHHGHDSNLRAAYVHVLADALTSVLAIVALTCGLVFGWVWLDPLMALVGVAVILSWSFGLMRTAGTVLLDMVPDRHLAGHIRKALEVDGDRVCDLHLWRLGPGHDGLIVSLVAPADNNAEKIKAALRHHYPDLAHVTVEVAVCADCT